MLGYVDFPPIGAQPYPLTVGPYGMLAFELHPMSEKEQVTAAEAESVQFALPAGAGWSAIFEGAGGSVLENHALPSYLSRQRWFAGKARRIRTATVEDWGEFESPRSALAFVKVQYEEGQPEEYLVPLAMSFGDAAGNLRASARGAILGAVISHNGEGVLHDAITDDGVCAALLTCIRSGREFPTRNGRIRGLASAPYAEIHNLGDRPLTPKDGSAEDGRSFILFGDSMMLKLFRRHQAGLNPDCEISEFLTTRSEFRSLPPFAGTIRYESKDGESTLAMLEGQVPNEGDGWNWTLEELDRYYEDRAHVPFRAAEEPDASSVFELSQEVPRPLASEHLGLSLDSAAALGRRSAELHLALAAGAGDPAFEPEPLGPADIQALAETFEEHAVDVLDQLKENFSRLPDDVVETAGLVLSRRRRWLDRFRSLKDTRIHGFRTRIHGDYHLGKVLRVRNDYVVVDFDGAPTESTSERRAKHSPLKDVAGMIRSFSYAGQMALMNYTARRPDDPAHLHHWARLWVSATSAEFLRSYRDAAGEAAFLPGDAAGFRALLDAYLLDKALRELRYELVNRPEWIRIPLAGFLSMAG